MRLTALWWPPIAIAFCTFEDMALRDSAPTLAVDHSTAQTPTPVDNRDRSFVANSAKSQRIANERLHRGGGHVRVMREVHAAVEWILSLHRHEAKNRRRRRRNGEI